MTHELPEPDLVLHSVMPDGPGGAHYYRACSVLHLLAAQHAQIAQIAAERDAARAEAATAYDVCGPMVGTCQACGHEHELPNGVVSGPPATK